MDTDHDLQPLTIDQEQDTIGGDWLADMLAMIKSAIESLSASTDGILGH